MKRDDSLPAFTRTEHCDVLLDWGGSEGAPTPEELGEAVNRLIHQIRSHVDGQCTELSARSSGDCNPQVPSATFAIEQFITCAAFIFLAVLLIIMLVFSCGEADESGRLKGYTWLGLLASVVLLGFLLRIFRLDIPFSDALEAERIQFSDHPMVGLLLGIFRSQRHPPLTYLAINTMLSFGNSELLLRIPFVLAGTASIAITGYLGKRLGGPWAGIMAAACVAVCAPLIDGSRYLASHGLFIAILPLVCLLYLRLCESPTPSRIRALAVANALSMWTHYLTVVPLCIQAFDWFVQRRAGRPLSKALGKSILLTLLLSFLPIYYMVAGFFIDVESKQIDRQGYDALVGKVTALDILHDMHSIPGRTFTFILVLFFAVFFVMSLLKRNRLRDTHVSPFSDTIRATLMAWSIPAAIILLSSVSWMQGYYAVVSLPLIIPLSMAGVMAASESLARIRRPSTDGGKAGRFMRGLGTALGGLAASVLVLAAADNLAKNGASYLYDRNVRSGVAQAVEEIRSRDPDTIVLLHDSTYAIAAYYLRDGCLHRNMCVNRTCHLMHHKVMLLLSMEDMRKADWKDRLANRFNEIISKRKVWYISGIPLTRWYRRSNIDGEFEKTILATGSCKLHKTFAENVKVYLCGKD